MNQDKYNKAHEIITKIKDIESKIDYLKDDNKIYIKIKDGKESFRTRICKMDNDVLLEVDQPLKYIIQDYYLEKVRDLKDEFDAI